MQAKWLLFRPVFLHELVHLFLVASFISRLSFSDLLLGITPPHAIVRWGFALAHLVLEVTSFQKYSISNVHSSALPTSIVLVTFILIGSFYVAQ